VIFEPLLRQILHATATILAFLAVGLAATPAGAKGDAASIENLQIGFGGVFKLGCWTPLSVELAAGSQPFAGRVLVESVDSDGVATQIVAPADGDVELASGETTRVAASVCLGRRSADLIVRAVDSQDVVQCEARFAPRSEGSPRRGEFAAGLPAMQRVVLLDGFTASASELFGLRTSDKSRVRFAVLGRGSEWPRDWRDYEGVETVVLRCTSSERDAAASEALASGLRTLARWVESGGRLALFCGADAESLLRVDGPYAALIPGKFDAVSSLKEAETAPLESFAGVQSSVSQGEFEIPVPRLVAVEGRILAYRGQRPTDLPLVIRARRGLGTITFVGLDPEARPFADWSGRASLLRRALGWPSEETVDRAAGESPTNEDLTNQLRKALDVHLSGVSPASFGLVAALALIYVAAIGPGDFLLLKRLSRRMHRTWITFPATVAAACAGAYFLAHSMKGRVDHANQIEIVDVDLETGEVRGTVWTQFFSASVDRRDLALRPQFGEQQAAGAFSPPEVRCGWLGSPGGGLGGMLAPRAQAALFSHGYGWRRDLAVIERLPTEKWSTKSLAARWSGRVAGALDARLRLLPDDLVAGVIVNRTGVAWREAVLLHGGWAYQLPRLKDGEQAAIESSLPRTVKTALTGVDAGDAALPRPSGDGAAPYDPYGVDVARILKTMMFYEAVGGERYAGAASSYRGDVDLSQLLDGDQAVLLVRADHPGSAWIDQAKEEPLGSPEVDRRWVYYRFVIPLSRPVEMIVPLEASLSDGGRGLPPAG
jgi:hypothetical protein